MGASKFPCIQSDRIRIFSPPHSALGPFCVPLIWDLRAPGAGHSPKQCTSSILTSIPSFPATNRCFHCPGLPPQASRALWGMGECSSSSYDRARWLYSRSLSDHSELKSRIGELGLEGMGTGIINLSNNCAKRYNYASMWKDTFEHLDQTKDVPGKLFVCRQT